MGRKGSYWSKSISITLKTFFVFLGMNFLLEMISKIGQQMVDFRIGVYQYWSFTFSDIIFNKISFYVGLYAFPRLCHRWVLQVRGLLPHTLPFAPGITTFRHYLLQCLATHHQVRLSLMVWNWKTKMMENKFVGWSDLNTFLVTAVNASTFVKRLTFPPPLSVVDKVVENTPKFYGVQAPWQNECTGG